MIREHDTIALTTDLPAHAPQRGDLGTVVLVHGDQGYEVEFATIGGETLAVISLATDQVRPLGPREIAQARALA